MRTWIALAALVLIASPAFAQKKPEPPPRFGVPAETEFFPQETPKQTLASLDKAFGRRRIDYVLAHMLDPIYADQQVAKYYRQRFGKAPDDDRELSVEQRDARLNEALKLFIAEVSENMASEGKKTLRFFRMLKEGLVEEAGTTAKVTLKDAPSVTLTLRQVDGRWYMDNANEESGPAKAEPGKTEK